MSLLDRTLSLTDLSEADNSRRSREFISLSSRSIQEIRLGGSTPQDLFLNKIADGIGALKGGYWFGGESTTEDSVVIEFLSTRAPTIRVFIDKKELEKYFPNET